MNTLLQKFIDKSIIIQCYYIFFLQRMRVIFDLTFHPKTINNITTLRQPNCKDDIRYSFRSSRYIFFPCLSSIYSMTFIKNNFIEIEFIHHTTHSLNIYHQCFLVYLQSCATIIIINFRIFSLSQKKPVLISSHSSFLPKPLV